MKFKFIIIFLALLSHGCESCETKSLNFRWPPPDNRKKMSPPPYRVLSGKVVIRKQVVEKNGDVTTFYNVKTEIDATDMVIVDRDAFEAAMTELWNRREYDFYVSEKLRQLEKK